MIAVIEGAKMANHPTSLTSSFVKDRNATAAHADMISAESFQNAARCNTAFSSG